MASLRATVVAIWAILLAIAGLAHAQAPPAPRDLALEDTDVLGCYELVSLVWTPPPAPESYSQPPRSFELTAVALGDSKFRRIRNPETGTFYPFSNWTQTSPTEVTASWSTGFVGVSLVVSRRTTDAQFYGRVDTFSDVGKPLRSRGQAIFTKVPCPAAY